MSQSEKLPCPQCGTPHVAGGLCPRCLLRASLLGLHGPAGGDGDAAPGYHLLEKIGEGGMGEVFLAEQIVPVRREVAVKFLRSELDAAEWTRRFGIEREALAQLDHPNIAMILDAGTGRDGRPFYVMELIDGLPLTQFCQRAKTDTATRLRLFGTVCAAVQHAHQKGVLHGDLKPSNILVEVDELGAPVPKLIDFGVARAARLQARDGAAPLWQFGTAGYASPEQFRATRAPDARSDVYSLGIVLRELLEDDPATRRVESRYIIQCATAPLPEGRYESAAALAADVRALLENRPLAAGPKTWRYRAAKFCRRRRWRIAIVSLVCLAVLGGGALLMRQAWLTRRAAEDTEALRKTAGEETVRSRFMHELAHGLAQALREPDERHRRHLVDTLLQRLGAFAEDVAAGGQSNVAFTLHMALAAGAQGLGDPDKAAQHFLAARDLAQADTFPGDPRRRAAEGALSRSYMAARRFDLAEPVLKSLMEEAPPDQAGGPDTWDPLLDLTRLYLQTRRFDEAAAPALRAVEVTERRFNRLHPFFLEALHQLGLVRTEQKQYEEAHRLLLESVAGMTKQFGADAPPARAAAADLAEVEEVLRNMEKLPPK